MKCPVIAILVTIVLVSVAILLYLEHNNPYTKSIESEEGFTGGHVDAKGNAPVGRTGTNLLENGSFTNGKDVKGHFGASIGNKKIVFPNPGKSSYVLEQGYSGQAKNHSKTYNTTNYSISTKVKPGNYYRFSSWIYDSDKKRNEDNYTLIFHLKSDSSISHKTQSASLQTYTVEHNVWSQEDIIFQVPTDSNGTLDIVLQFTPGTSSERRYITDLWLENFHPLLSGFPSSQELAFYSSVFQSESFGKNNGRMWKDLSNHGKDFLFSKSPDYSSQAIDLDKERILGPPCSELGIQTDQFSFGWNLRAPRLPSSRVFARMFTSAESGSVLEISYISDHPVYSKLKVDYQGKSHTWDIGLTDILSVYILVVDGAKMTLYKDGVAMSGNSPTKTSSSKNSTSYFINKPLIVNPNSNFGGVLYDLFCFQTAISKEEALAVYHYLAFNAGKNMDKQTYSGLKKAFCRPGKEERHFPVPPIRERDIMKTKEKIRVIKEEERHVFEHKCKQLIQENEREKKRAKQVQVLCNANTMKSKTPSETQVLIKSLVKAFNEKESAINDDCTKTVYHIQDDGKVIRKVLKNPNCGVNPPIEEDDDCHPDICPVHPDDGCA